jgi:hypothetical protein
MSTALAGGVGTPVCLGFAFSSGVGTVQLIGQIVVIATTFLASRALCLRLRAEISK